MPDNLCIWLYYTFSCLLYIHYFWQCKVYSRLPLELCGLLVTHNLTSAMLRHERHSVLLLLINFILTRTTTSYVTQCMWCVYWILSTENCRILSQIPVCRCIIHSSSQVPLIDCTWYSSHPSGYVHCRQRFFLEVYKFESELCPEQRSKPRSENRQLNSTDFNHSWNNWLNHFWFQMNTIRG